MSNFKIKTKLLILFILIKVIPLLVISYIALEGAKRLDSYFDKSTKHSFLSSKNIIELTARTAIEDSVAALDKKSQNSLERLSFEIANKIALFLYERDNDLIFLSKLENIDENLLKSFMDSKKSTVTIHQDYYYDDETSSWLVKERKEESKTKLNSILKDNEKEFNHIKRANFDYKKIPLYKEVQFIDLQGNEIYKVSNINKNKINIKNKSQTYCKAENYYEELKSLKKGEIYVSDVIGEYVGSKIIGTFTKEKAAKANIKFEPEKYGYAGKENPVGKRFEGIVRFATPVFKNNEKIGYISFALDHRHIMEFSDSCDPISSTAKQDIADAGSGNYAFIWDYEGKNISHARDYFIVGYDANTGKRVPGWLSSDIATKFKESQQKDLGSFLETYPTYEMQSLDKKPNLSQIKDGSVGLDCRYLNFAPQCTGWMNLTGDGGFGSFIIYWSKVWKLTTAAAIPYYSGKYKNSKRGFGFVTIGANVEEFHSAANKTKENIDTLLQQQVTNMKRDIDANNLNISSYIQNLINEISYLTLLMVIIVVFIALWMSNFITNKIKNLLKGTQEYASHNFDYKIEVTTNDEIGELEKSFNDMSTDIKNLIDDQKNYTQILDAKVKEQLKQLRQRDEMLINQSKMASMGEMIGNIAHQWRQPLNIIGTINTSLDFKLARGTTLTESEYAPLSQRINEQLQYMSTTIDDFRNFFTPRKTKENFFVLDSVDSALKIVGASLKNNYITVKVSKEFDAQINGYKNELSQVIINLLNNAKDVMTKIEDEQKKLILIRVYKKEDNIIIDVVDNADGISEDIIDKIFEPYFTTKFKSAGTGIGLYMSYEIITKHLGGTLEASNGYNFEDIEYGGAVITISLPIVANI